MKPNGVGAVQSSKYGTKTFMRMMEKETPSGREPQRRMMQVMTPQKMPAMILPVLYLRMPHRRAHHEVVAQLADLEEVYTVKEL